MTKSILKQLKLLTILTIAICSGQVSFGQQNGKNLWFDISESSVILTGERYTFPSKYRTLHLDFSAMKQFLSNAPLESPTGQRNSEGLIFSMPMPDGRSENFEIFETYVMHPELAAKFPEIKTYLGQGIDDVNATIRLDMTPLGFHAMILSPAGNIFIDPYCQYAVDDYICYDKKDLRAQSPFVCSAETELESRLNQTGGSLSGLKSSGAQLRTYRLAVACTGEYAATKGGTVSGALAGIVTTINRVDGVYETEVAVRMVLIPNNNLLVYTNGATDPYTNNNGVTMLGENVTNCNAVIGSANFDIGHVFSTGGGGVAGLGVVCGASKANGVTGSPNPVGDPFDIDYVAHEIGHQFGGNHTFNSQTGACGGGNRVASAAYEPGSGITIMAYAGICGSDDLAPNSIAYFHTKSFDEMVIFTTTGNGNTCAVNTASGNTPPVVTSQGGTFSIPVSTPFVLTGVATDADGDSLTYSWEQFDLGTAGAWNANLGSAPIFRPFAPVTSPSRTFPKLSDIINNTTTVGEILPNVARVMHFRLTVRDNRMGGGGVMHNDTSLAVTVVNNGGAFAVTAPNTAVTWAGGSAQTVTWNVNGTTGAPINCSNVKILLSTDGGNTFPTTILASTSNDGTESIIVPNIATTTARIKVEAVGNIFFDMSNVNFTITAGSVLTSISTSTISPTTLCEGAQVNVPYSINGPGNPGNIFTAQLSNSSGSFASPTVIGTLGSTAAGTISATIPSGTTAGSGYRIRVVSSAPVVTGSDNGANITINILPLKPGVINQSGGTTKACPGDVKAYSVFSVAGATSYTWTPPAGAVIASGQGTKSITVNFLAGFTASDSLKVVANNSCGSSVARTKFITRDTPAKPGVISGQASGVCNLAGVPYQVTSVSGITYNWFYSAGGANVATGQGSNSITANYTPAYTSGNLNVTAANACGVSAARTLAVKSVLATPGAITGATGVCVAQDSVPYSIVPVIGAVTYTWSGPAGSRFSDGVITSTTASLTTTASAVTVNFATTAGSIKVKANNACGSSNNKSLTVSFVCKEGINSSSQRMGLSVYPNPVSTDLAIQFNSSINENYYIRLTDLIGKAVILKSGLSVIGENQTKLELSGLANGIYTLEVRNGEHTNYKKVVVE